jgi:hydroxymethylbilane synthase
MLQHVRIGTRASALALTQTGHVADALSTLGRGDLTLETVRIRTDGDRLTGSLQNLGGTGVFVTALRDAMVDGRCDVAVHSLKDLPTGDFEGLSMVVPLRENPSDALCARDGLTLAELPPGASVGTGSPRRAAQLLAVRPDLVVVDIRGNVDTRLGRVAGSPSGPGDLDAVVLARAGLARRGRRDAGSEELAAGGRVPAAGQGALAVEVRTSDLVPGTPLEAALRALDHRPTHLAVVAERALLARLGAGCAAPIGVTAQLTDHGRSLSVESVIARLDGSGTLRRGTSTTLGTDGLEDARRLGAELAETLLDAGAADLAVLGAAR